MADYKNIIPFILKWEGGLSHSIHDSAKNDPVPDGTGTHTNKGVTWSTFKSFAAQLRYVPSIELFYQMPEHIWGEIFKVGYWNKILGDQIVSQAIADTLVDWAWGSGPGTATYKMQQFLKIKADHLMGPQTLNAINDMSLLDDRSFNREFSEYKLAWYLSLAGQENNYKGWSNRLNDLYHFTDPLTLNFKTPL